MKVDLRSHQLHSRGIERRADREVSRAEELVGEDWILQQQLSWTCGEHRDIDSIIGLLVQLLDARLKPISNMRNKC